MNKLNHATYLLIAVLVAQSTALNAAFDGKVHPPKILLNYGPRSPKARRMAMDRRLALIEAKLRNIHTTQMPSDEFEKIGRQLDALQRAYSLPDFDKRILMGPLERAKYDQQQTQQMTRELEERFTQQRREHLRKLDELKREFTRIKLEHLGRKDSRRERRAKRLETIKTAKANYQIRRRRRS